uniref:Programmed cell death protein 5 n=1 Tax=Steinernema glaseri TaxID=37863 RepID=A0A1I8A8V2_9BILA
MSSIPASLSVLSADTELFGSPPIDSEQLLTSTLFEDYTTMEDPEMAAIRARRMAQLQGGAGQAADGGANQKEAQARKAAAEQQEDMKNSILSQCLHQDAIARLSNLAAAKPEKARMVENMIVQMARRGQIAGKMSDAALRQLLDRVSEQTQRTTTVKFDRRRAAIDSDSD